MAAFARWVAPEHDAHLLLAGPAVGSVVDDPPAAAVRAECIAAWRGLPEDIRNRITLACLPMDDLDENATIVSAIQRHAAVVTQKSLAEGFGLGVLEAQFKGQPVVASAVGGMRNQVIDGETGLLVEDPTDLRSFAAIGACWAIGGLQRRSVRRRDGARRRGRS